MVLDTRLLDIITNCFYGVYQWFLIIMTSFFGFNDGDWIIDDSLRILFPLFSVTIIISFIFVVIKILRKFIWGV